MHNHVAYSGRKAFLKQIFSVFLIFTITFNTAFAGAAEKWDYDVVPDQNQRLNITGHKVDQYGKAINDSVYKTSIDTRLASPRSKMGAVGMGRLLKATGWGLLGTAALQGLLEAVDWVIDPNAQSIWRYKQTGDVGFGCKNFGYKWKAGTSVYTCPADAFPDFNICKTNSTAKDCKISNMWADQYHTTKVSDLSSSSIPQIIDIEVTFTYNGTQTANYIRVTKDAKLVEPPKEKEQLSPEQLADYANHTHPDFADPELAPKLNPKWNPNIAPDLFKPANQWEKDNSPTVKEVESQLDKSQPNSNDTGIKPNQPAPTPENPTPAPNGFNLPNFCDWANTVCDFMKDDSIDQNEEPELPKEINIGQLNTGTFKSTPGCPAPIPINITIGTKGTTSISYEPICQFASKWSFVAPLIGFLSAAMILVGVGRKGEDSEI
jgi:hypothetical protein